MEHNSVVSRHPKSIRIPRVDGLSCDAPILGGPVDNPSTRGNLWILGALISHSHVSYIETYSFSYK